MSRTIISIKPTTTITDASKTMKKNKISSLPIMEGNELVGIITTTDLVNIYTNADQERHIDPWDEVSKFMSSPVVTIKEQDSVKSASKIMSERRFHHLVVVDENGKLTGIVSSIDIAKVVDD